MFAIIFIISPHLLSKLYSLYCNGGYCLACSKFSPGNMKFGGLLLFTGLKYFRRAMACDPEKCLLSMFRALISPLNITYCCWNSSSLSRYLIHGTINSKGNSIKSYWKLFISLLNCIEIFSSSVFFSDISF